MEDLAKRGRHRGLGMTLVSQRGQEVAKSVLELMETVVLLRTTGPRSIKAVQDWISVNADDGTLARDVIASLPTLDTGEGWVWSPSFLRILTRTTFPLFRTFDSHATPTPGQTRQIPRARADIDLDKLAHDIAATRERTHANTPHAHRPANDDLTHRLAAAEQRAARAEQQLADRDAEITALRQQIDELERRPHYDQQVVESLQQAATLLHDTLDTLTDTTAPAPADSPRPPANPTPPTPQPPPPPTSSTPTPRFRAGAQRMLTSLARMAPLRLTKAQWGTVAQLKHTGGTFSTYLGELRRNGLVDETTTGYTLTSAGWDYLGTQPAPMTAHELQQHYLSILRSGASRMLQACIDAYPRHLTKADLAHTAGITSSGGTFSTYLGELRRNGLIIQNGDEIVASEILMHGAATQPPPHQA